LNRIDYGARAIGATAVSGRKVSDFQTISRVRHQSRGRGLASAL